MYRVVKYIVKFSIVRYTIALRTIVVPVSPTAQIAKVNHAWEYHLQAGAGVVMDSDPSKEYEETANKAAGLARALDLAESAFVAH